MIAHARTLLLSAVLALLIAGCATTPDGTRASEAAIAVAESFRQALAKQDVAGAMAVVSEDFTSPAWPTREDLRFYLNQERERVFGAPASIAAESPEATAGGDTVRVYPVGLRTRGVVAVFDLSLVMRDAEWRIVSAALEFY